MAKALLGLLLLPSDVIISVTRQLFIFAGKQKDRLFWDENGVMSRLASSQRRADMRDRSDNEAALPPNAG